MAKVAFIGLGVMGYPMAGHLAAKGHEVTVYNRTAAKSAAWVAAHGGTAAATPREAALAADMVMACVGNDDDLRMICLGDDGAFGGMAKGTAFVDHTTVSAAHVDLMRTACGEAGVQYAEAPMTRTPASGPPRSRGIMPRLRRARALRPPRGSRAGRACGQPPRRSAPEQGAAARDRSP